MPPTPSLLLDRRHLTVAVLGHLGHGKTSLASALLARANWRYSTASPPLLEGIAALGGGSPALRHSFRGTMQGAYLPLETNARRYTLIDCPGHRDYVHNAINGISQSDAAILVVAQHHGIEAQTREHILLAHQLGVRSLVVFLSFQDAVTSPEQSLQVERQVRLLLLEHEYPGDDVTVVPGSTRGLLNSPAGSDPAWQCLDALLSPLDHLPTPEREDGPVVLPIAWVQRGRSHTGEIDVQGRIEQGTLRPGEQLELVGTRALPPVLVGERLESAGVRVDAARAGDVVRVATLLPNDGPVKIRRGQILATPGTLSAHQRLEADVHLLPQEAGGRGEPVFVGQATQFFFRNLEATGTVRLPAGVVLHLPGQTHSWAIDLDPAHAVVVTVGQRFVIRASSQTIGLGTVRRILD